MEQYEFSVRGSPRAKPTAGIFDDPSVSVCLNEDWIPLVVGVLAVLLQPEYWSGDPVDAQREIAALYARLTDIAGDCGLGDIQDLRVKSGAPCTVEKKVNGVWSDAFDISECAETAAETATNDLRSELDQPGPEVGNPDPVPLGECQSYRLTVPANGAIILPFKIEPGDTIEVTGQGGAWSSGRGAPVNAWYCFDQDQFILGACNPSYSDPNNGDLLVTAKEHAMLLWYDSVYYDVTSGPIVIPSGASQADGLLMINDSVRGDNAGALDVIVEHCKETAWCYLFDFTSGSGGWTARDGDKATYVSGQGWASVPGGTGITFGIDLNHGTAIPVGTVVTAVYDVTGTGTTGNIAIQNGTDSHVHAVVNGLNQEIDVASTVPDTFYRVVGSRGGGTAQQILVKSVLFRGTSGTNPFGADNC